METAFKRNTQSRNSAVAEHISSGVPSLDFFLGKSATPDDWCTAKLQVANKIFNHVHAGGGLCFNTLSVIAEDEYGVYSMLLLKALVSANLHKSNRIVLVNSGLQDVNSVVKRLPTMSKVRNEIFRATGAETMKIAWRYTESATSPGLSRVAETEAFDFGHTLSDEDFQKMSHNVDIWDVDSCFANIKELANGTDRQSVIIILPGLLSATSSEHESELLKLVYKLKASSRCVKRVVILITVQSSLMSQVTKKRLYNIADSVFELHTFPENKSPYTDYLGLLKFVKLPRAKGLGYVVDTETLEIGFQLKKNNRFLVVDKLSLPPDLGDAPSRTTCGTSNKLDF